MTHPLPDESYHGTPGIKAGALFSAFILAGAVLAGLIWWLLEAAR